MLFSYFLLVGSSLWSVGFFQLGLPLAQNSTYATGLLSAQTSQSRVNVNFLFSVSYPLQIVFSFIVFIHVYVAWKNAYVKPRKWVLFFFWECSETNVIAIVIVITFNVIVIEYVGILCIRNQACGK